MTTALAIRTILEIAAVLFVIYGVINEKKFVAFEDKVIRFVARAVYVRKRKKAMEKKRALQQAKRRREAQSQPRPQKATVYRYVA